MSDVVEMLRSAYGFLTPGAIDSADLDGMAFTVSEAADEIERLREALGDAIAFMAGDISGSSQRDGIIKQGRAALKSGDHD